MVTIGSGDLARDLVFYGAWLQLFAEFGFRNSFKDINSASFSEAAVYVIYWDHPVSLYIRDLYCAVYYCLFAGRSNEDCDDLS